ncbi:rhodanese-like domain-containing protein [Larkinella bovis]|uniref:Rhodanese-like domain-containing protein n=1 Tax=Larkinella bovis TaxID=683041 RepID=A0ABW0IKU3_9BACT
MGIISALFTRKSTNFKALVDAGAVIVDVRSPQEYASGHIAGSRNIPLDTIASNADRLLKEGRTIITCCRSGARSGMAQSILKSKGIEAYNGGAWNSLDINLK